MENFKIQWKRRMTLVGALSIPTLCNSFSLIGSSASPFRSFSFLPHFVFSSIFDYIRLYTRRDERIWFQKAFGKNFRAKMSSIPPPPPPLSDNLTVVGFLSSPPLFFFSRNGSVCWVSFEDLLMDSCLKWRCTFAQLGCGSAVLDLLAAVAAFPKPDDKIRSTSLKVGFLWLLGLRLDWYFNVKNLSCGVFFQNMNWIWWLQCWNSIEMDSYSLLCLSSMISRFSDEINRLCGLARYFVGMSGGLNLTSVGFLKMGNVIDFLAKFLAYSEQIGSIIWILFQFWFNWVTESF